MHCVFQTFIDRLNESNDAASFRHTMADAAQAFDRTVMGHQETGRYKSVDNDYTYPTIYQHAGGHVSNRKIVVPNLGGFPQHER